MPSSHSSTGSGSDGGEIADFLEHFGSSSDDGDLGAAPTPTTSPEPERTAAEPEQAPSAEPDAFRWRPEPEYVGPLSGIDWPLLQRLYRSGARASVGCFPTQNAAAIPTSTEECA
jgi:hypothetical protein